MSSPFRKTDVSFGKIVPKEEFDEFVKSMEPQGTFVTAIQCGNCGDLIFSRARHDFHPCSCFENEIDNKGVAIDGGDDYIRVLGNFNGKSYKIRVPYTKQQIYDDWNKRTDKIGTISKEKVKDFVNAADTEVYDMRTGEKLEPQSQES